MGEKIGFVSGRIGTDSVFGVRSVRISVCDEDVIYGALELTLGLPSETWVDETSWALSKAFYDLGKARSNGKRRVR